MDTRKYLGYALVAFIGYELLAYLINRSVWQKAIATGDYSGQMPWDFLGAMIGYGSGGVPPAGPGAAVALPPSVGVPPALRPVLPLFRPVPIPPPMSEIPNPDILMPPDNTPPYITWPQGA
jgi:hypothetical protein